MIKTILVCTDGSDHGGVASEYGVFLAKRLQARLDGLHVLDSRMLEGPLMADISGWIGAQPFGAQLHQFRALLQQRGEAVVEAFNARCARDGLEVSAEVRMGHPARVILDAEATTELLVLGERGEHADILGNMLGSTVERVVRRATTPCLVTPAAFRPVGKILAAYDGSSHGAKALRQAVEMAAALGAPLLILTVAESRTLEEAEQIAEDGLKIAEAHHCPAERKVIEGEPEDLILEQARAEGCDLIAVGAYGQSRIREMFIGSTTNQLISDAEIPVLLVP